MISSDHLDPGTVGQIKATIDTAGRIGSLERYITIHSNDPVSPAFTLSLSVEIVP